MTRWIALACAVLASAAGAADANRTRMVLKRNVFKQSFLKPAPLPQPGSIAPRPRVIVFTGAIRIGDDRVAIFEEKTAGRVQFLAAGDEIEKARVVRIGEETVVISDDGVERTLELGQTLTGAPAPATSDTPAQGPPAPGPAAPAPATSPPAPVTPLAARPLPPSLKERIEAMKRRRQQEQQKAAK